MDKLQKLEAYLFIKGESHQKKDLVNILECTKDELQKYILELKELYKNHSIVLIETETELSLATSTQVASFLENIEKEERGGELSKASLETLSIIAYKNGASRSEIDYIRGVNSSFILRNLYLRGLITKIENQTRSPVYIISASLMSFLGISDITELPDFEKFQSKLNESTDDPVEN